MQDQNLALQLDALKTAGCDKIYQEKVSGVKVERPELTKLLELVREGDTLPGRWCGNLEAGPVRPLFDTPHQVSSRSGTTSGRAVKP